MSRSSILRPLAAAFLSVVTIAGCRDEIVSIARIDNDMTTAFWRAALNHHAITLSTYAPWDTVQLVMVGSTYNGDIVSSDEALITYESADSNLVSVTPTGKVRAKAVTSGIQIFSTMSVGNVTYKDTAVVKVIANPLPKKLATFSFQPIPPDSAKTSISTFPYTLQRFVKATDTSGAPMTGLFVYYKSLDPIRATVDRSTGALSPLAILKSIGPVTFVASTYVYGVVMTDTLHFRMGYSLRTNLWFRQRGSTDSIGTETYVEGGTPATIGVGGIVRIENQTEKSVLLEFEDTTHIQVSTVVVPNEPVNRQLADNKTGAMDNTNVAYRRFLAPGLYKFRDRESGVSGAIQVIQE